MLGIDLGSNTMRAVLMDENLSVLKEAEFIIGAAKNLNESGVIGTEAIEKLKNALKVMQAQGFNLENAQAVATAAFRKARNTAEIFKDLKAEFNISFKVIDAKTEAKLSILGMKNALARLGIKESELCFCDLGGASCELSFDENYKSFDFGLISFYEKVRKMHAKRANLSFERLFKKYRFAPNFKDKKLNLELFIKDDFLRMLAFKAFDEVSEAREHFKKFKGKTVVLNSGVPTALVALKQGLNYENYKASLINGQSLCLGDFLNFGLKLWQMSEENAKIRIGNRKNYLCAGCFLLYALFDKKRFIVVDEGLREGVCVQEFLNLKEKK